MNELLLAPTQKENIVVIETWHEGTEWYRVWSDGWIEQGGDLSGINANSSTLVSFHKPFSDVNYTLVSSPRNTRGTDANSDWLLNFCPISATQFAYRMRDGTSKSGCMWYACGY